MIGQTISHYKILEKLGGGGMGVVYKARDTRLDRFVAIKVLPPEKVADPERKRRFVQEARAASALNHPNIITIYDIGQADGIDFIAMEYVDGRTLEELIGRKGVKLSEALKVSVQMADALAAAHEVGIVHRDLKPGNLMVTGKGQVKVLDFGLAKLTEKLPTGAEDATLTAKPDTEEGKILGTVAYMSPEQAEGKELDSRSDIFSFGSVLYEMVSGKLAFEADSKASTLGAIIHKEPKPLAGRIPHDLEKAIARCLRKNADRRFQHMADLKVALEELKEESDSGALEAAGVPEAAVHGRLWWVGVLAGIAVIVAIMGIAGWFWFGHSHPTPTEAPLSAVPLTSYAGSESYPTFSPDGNQVAFNWDGEKEDNSDIYVKLIGAEPPMRLTTNPANEFSPVWSPDGRWIAFLRDLSGGKCDVVLVPPMPGPERILTESFFSSNNVVDGPFLSWSPDSRWLAVVGSSKPDEAVALWLISLESNEKWEITFPPKGCEDSCPAFSPDGHTLAFFRWPAYSKSDLYLLDLSSELKPKGDPKCIAVGKGRWASPTWDVDGRSLVFSVRSSTSNSLWRIAVSESSPPKQLASIGANGSYPVISRRGNRLAYAQGISDWNIWRMEITSPKSNASPPSKLVSSTRSEGMPQLSPDGKKIAFASDRSGNGEVWVCDVDGANAVRLTSFGGATVTWIARWSPEGKRLTFSANPEGHDDVYVVNANGGSPHRITSDPRGSNNPSWCRDGKGILFDIDDSGKSGIYRVPGEGGAPLLVTNKAGWAPVESPDGQFIYGFKNELGGISLWKVPSGGGDEQQVLDSVDFWNVELAGDGIYFTRPEKQTSHASLQFLNTTTGKTERIASFSKPIGGFSVSPDRRWIVYGQLDQSGSDLMLVENFR